MCQPAKQIVLICCTNIQRFFSFCCPAVGALLALVYFGNKYLKGQFQSRMWCLFLSFLLQTSTAFPIFTFDSSPASPATPSYAQLVKDVQLPSDSFVLCSSVKQARFEDFSFFSVAGNDHREWLKMRLQTKNKNDEVKVALLWDDSFYRLGKLQNPRLDFWYHICARVDLDAHEIEVAVNGKLMGKACKGNVTLTNIPTKLEMILGVAFGKPQFHGSVSNIQML